MSQSDRLISALKRELKSRDITYDDLASHLGVSESTVKRMFSKGGFTLERLEAIARYANIEILELARLGEADRHRVHALTHEQEQELVSDPKLMLTAICAMNRWQFEDIVTVYSFQAPELIQMLIRLDRLGLIELLPGNRIRLLVERNFSWLPQGPIHQFFVRQFQDQFLSGSFDAENELHEFRWGMIATEHAATITEGIRDLMAGFTEQTHSDELRPRGDTRGMCLLAAFKEWEPQEFEALRT